MKLYLLDLGHMELDANVVVAGTTRATKSDPNMRSQWVKIPMVAALVVSDDGHKILYDCGSNYEAMNGYWRKGLTEVAPFYSTSGQEIRAQLALCGFAPEDIDILVLSHMHLDHMGNIALFRNAQVIVEENEFSYALRMVHQSADPDRHGFYIKSEVTCAVRQYTLVQGDYYLCPGIELLSLPGHSAGMLGMKLKLKNTGTVILTQDACYSAKNYGPPALPSGLAHDSGAYFASIEKVRDMARREEALVIFGHDMEQFRSLKHTPDCYD